MPGLRGASFIFDKVVQEVAHRFGDELLLWDSWGRIGRPNRAAGELDTAWLEPIAEMLLSADRDDEQAERALLDRYRTDDGLHPSDVIRQASPYGEAPIDVRLGSRERRSRSPRSRPDHTPRGLDGDVVIRSPSEPPVARRAQLAASPSLVAVVGGYVRFAGGC